MTTSYLTTQGSYDYACDPSSSCSTSASANTAIHIRSLPTQVSVYNSGSTERARTTFEYDNYGSDSSHASLVSRSSISGLDSGFTTSLTTRGNATGTTRYLLNSSGSVTGSISAYAQYDVAGNTVKAIDARGYATAFDFADRFGAPNGDAEANTSPTELSTPGQSSFAFATKVTNALNQSAYVQFDYYVGKSVDSEDANGIVASGYYNDMLDRTTQVKRAVGVSGVENQTTFAYDDANHTVTITRDLSSNGDNTLKSVGIYDALGRTTENRQYETSSNYIITKREYDALGRAYRVSNPYRPSESAFWNTFVYDTLGRTVSATMPDSAVVSSYYNGNQVLVKDQAGKERMSQTNALGQLKDVWEITAADDSTESISFPGHAEVTAGYRTKYEYDTLGNLITVNQQKGTGGTIQTRSFSYDTLSRLSSALNPENGTVSYQYDNNGNVTQKTDARGVVTYYGYDALNRNTAISYSDGVTMSVGRAYDQTAYGIGRLSWEWQCLDATHCGSADSFNYDALGRAANRNQGFYTNGVLGANFGVYAWYDLAGNIKTETYPSGHTVTYNYDSAGRLADKIPGSQTPSELAFSGNLGDNATRTYAKGLTYDAGSRMTRELFGTDTLLYHNSHYNVRGQLYDTRVGSGTDGNGSEFTWNRGCLQMYYESSYTWGASGPSNNGNLLRSLQYLPNNDPITSFSMNNEDYTYDSLNRLTSASEAGPIYTQSYTYDRWGNRTIDYNNSSSNIPRQQFTVAASTNRLGVPSGQSGTMTYDSAGNLTNDTYSGQGQRIYDGENHMTAAQDNYSAWSYYTYDAGGNRVRRKINNQETWQIYGIGGELLAEYAANGSPTSPQKEYGYRSGQLLVTATSTTNDIQWLVTDQLGTPRMIFDKTGSLAGTKRHDYLPFGEELYAGIGSRSAALGYGVANDSVRQKFTQKERDNETWLDYFEARSYASTQGRFTSADSYGGRLANPQTLNRYTYVIGNPLKYNDPNGHRAQDPKYCKEACKQSKAEAERSRKEAEAEGTPVETTDTNICISFMCGKRLQLNTPFRRFSASGLYGFGLNPIGMVEAGGAPLAGGLISRIGSFFRGVFGRGATTETVTAVETTSTAVTETTEAVVQEALIESGVEGANTVENLLKSGGQLIGKEGSDTSIRLVQGDITEAKSFFDTLTKGGQVTGNPTYPGTQVRMPNGDVFGLRTVMSRSPGTAATIDVNAQAVPGISKIKFNP